MSGTGKHMNVSRRSPVQQNGTSSGGKVSKTPQNKGTKSSKLVLTPMNGELARQEDSGSSGMRDRSSSFGKEEMNLMAVRKVDPNVTNILSTVPQVMLYQYDQASGEWERTSIEGTLFIYSRSSALGYGFMILNRLNNNNMLEEVVPNMEFRVQSPFVLFKKRLGNIFGLCFQEESSCQDTGELLSSLGSQENHLPVNGHHSPRSRRNPALSLGMRSTSAPSFKNSIPADGKGPYLVDVLESRKYTSSESENSGSPDSNSSDHISFLATSSTTSLMSSAQPAGGGGVVGGATTHHSKVKSGITTKKVDHFSPGPASPKQQPKSGTPARNSGRTSSPRNVPSAGGSRGGQKSQQFSSASVSPVKSGRSRSPKQQQRQKQQNGNLSSSVGASVPRTRGGGGMCHAVSFDQGFGGGGSPLRSYTAPQASDYSQIQPSPAFELLAAQVSGRQHLHHQQQEQPMDKTARRLFSPDTSTGVTTTAGHVMTPKALFSISESVPSSLNSLFSRGTSAADSTTALSSSASVDQSSGVSGSHGGGVLPLKVISLEQLEKQMVADVPSPPISVNPLTIFSSTASQASTHFPLPATTKSSAPSQQGASFESNQHVLLQPSAFMTSSDSGPAVSGAHSIIFLQSSNTALNQQGLPQSFSTEEVCPAPPTTSVAISIEPPSPVVDLNASFTVSSAGGSSIPHHVQEQFFPAIPPLMHSPGMRAAPVSTVPPTQPQQSRGEPSSLATTTVPASAQPSSTAHQSKAPQTVSQTGTPKAAGKPSQQVSSTIEESPQLPCTPSRYSSQSTPSLTPLAELSVPRRHATAPAAPAVTAAVGGGGAAGGGGGLMSPYQFTHSTTTSIVLEEVDAGSSSKTTVKQGTEPVGLSKEQLQQALLYLIKHDVGFVNKLHEAYRLSLSEKQV